jgi:hypothetical protein
MFRGVFLTLCVAVGVAVGDSAIDVRSKRVSIDITTPTRLFPLVGPLASHVSRGIVELSLRVPVEMPNTASVNIALMTEDQFLSVCFFLFFFVFFFFVFFKANRTSCWVPALARGDSGDTLDVSITYGNYYVCAVYCGPENIVPLEVSVTALFSVPRDSAGSVPGRTPASQLARQQWWLSGLFLVQLALACFAFYGFPRGWEQRIFWMPYAVVVGSYLVLSIAEFSVQLEGNFLFLYPVRVMRVFRALWRLGASVYIGWICVGSYLLGAKARPAVWVRWGVLFVGCKVKKKKKTISESKTLVDRYWCDRSCFVFRWRCCGGANTTCGWCLLDSLFLGSLCLAVSTAYASKQAGAGRRKTSQRRFVLFCVDFFVCLFVILFRSFCARRACEAVCSSVDAWLGECRIRALALRHCGCCCGCFKCRCLRSAL